MKLYRQISVRAIWKVAKKIVLLDESEQNGPKQLLGYPSKFGHTDQVRLRCSTNQSLHMYEVVIETNFAVNYGRKMFVKLATAETARNEFFFF